MAQLPKSQYLLVLLLSSCSITHQLEDTYEQRFAQHNVVSIQDLQSPKLKNVPIPQVSPVVAVYPTAFTDQTGQAIVSLHYLAPLSPNNLTLCLLELLNTQEMVTFLGW